MAASFPHASVIPIALIGTREMMAPQKDKFPKIWLPIHVNYGQRISWLDWLASPEGGAMTPESIKQLADLDNHQIKSAIAKLYRKFTDQLMQSINSLGAP